jgi:alpha-N-arabinofuranosidase
MIYNKIKIIELKFLTVFLGIALCGNAQQNSTVVKIKKEDNAPIISKHIYGHFAEHLGRSIYDGFYVGDSSKIPNTNGIRLDIVKALKELKIPNLRWPGGCFADTYHWKDGIGPHTERPTIVNQWWGSNTEDNSFGTHDFLNMCELLETEPYVSGNVGSGTVQEFMDWVQYVNYEGVSPMSALRKKNGRDKAWSVKYWGIGNEAWGCGGNMTAEYYANEYRKYSTFISDWSNSGGLIRVASGANSADYTWTETLMKNIPSKLIESLALHHYAVIDWSAKSGATTFTEDQYFATMSEALKMDEYITKHTAIMDKYDPDKKVGLVVDEWGGWYDEEKGSRYGFLYQQNSMRDAVLAGVTLNIFNNHADRVKMANLAQCVNVLQAVILTKEEKMILTPTYHIMNMYKVHQDARLIPLDFDTPNYELHGKSIPAISISASKNSDGVFYMSLVNIDSKNENKIEIDLNDFQNKNFSASILNSKNIQDHNTFDNPSKIKPKTFQNYKINKGVMTITIPAFSIIVIEGK